MMRTVQNPFNQIRLRYLFLWWLLGLFVATLLIIVVSFADFFAGTSYIKDEFIMVLFVIMIAYAPSLIWILRNTLTYDLDLDKLIGKFPKGWWWIKSFGFVALCFLFSIGAFSTAAYLLSLVFPDFALGLFKEKVINPTPNTAFPELYFFTNWVQLIVFAPIVEEVIFRGFLIHMWSKRWGITRAIIFSSLLFAIGHTDLFGAFSFALLMSILYIKTNSLKLTIFCHAINNLIVTIIIYVTSRYPSLDQEVTLSALREGVVMGIILIGLTLPIIVSYLRRNWPKKNATLPYFVKS